MARTRSFDETEILWGAMDAFRRNGYAGVSIKQLEQATGLSSGSLYNAYGDKEGLFRAALAHYVDAFVAERVQAFAGPAATLDDLEQLFLSMLRAPLADGYGCLVINSAVEFGPGPSIATDGIRKGLGMVASGIRTVLAREIGAPQAAPATQHLMLLYQGILVRARTGDGGTETERVIRAEFDRLRKARPRRPARRVKKSTQQQGGQSR